LNLHFESAHTRSQFQNGEKSELLFVALSKTDEHRLPILYLVDPNGLFVRGFDADTLGTVIADKIRETMARLR
jgi:hypothetical protein